MQARSFLALSLLLAGVAGACLQTDPAPRYTPAWEPFDPDEEGWSRTRQVHVISDCQLHNLASLPVPERNLSAEAAVATAIRPPQLDLFSRDVLEWIVHEGAPESDVIVHLGDALDLACEGELQDFLEVMNSAGKPWFMAPGNHDCFYFGVYDPEQPGLWDDACYGAGRRLTKDLFVRLYLATLVQRQDPDGAALAGALGLTAFVGEPAAELAARLPLSFSWERPSAGTGFLDAVCWEIDPHRPWRSFLLQSIDISGETPEMDGSDRVLLLDSCQYTLRPQMIPNAWRSYPTPLNSGSGGEMLPNQLRVVRRWLESNRRAVLAFHHPFDALAPRSRSSIGWLRRERNASLTLTAHTHRGYFAHHDLGGDHDELELNVGSTTDWPMEWRVLAGYWNEEQRKTYIRAERHTLVEELSNVPGFFLAGWEVPLDAPDDYRHYKHGEASSGLFIDYYVAFHLVPYWLPPPPIWATAPARRTEAQVKDTLLWTYVRLLRSFPTQDAEGAAWPQGCNSDAQVIARLEGAIGLEVPIEDKIALLLEASAFERSRPSWDPESGENTDARRSRFKVSQAAWASRFENSRGRRLRVDDELIRVDWERAHESRP